MKIEGEEASRIAAIKGAREEGLTRKQSTREEMSLPVRSVEK